MRKYLISLFILFAVLIPFSVFADDIVMVLQAPAAGGTTCSGNYGETADGSSNSGDAGFTWVIRTAFDCTAAANATTFNMRLSNVDNSDQEVVFLIYEDNAGEPGALIWQSDAHYWADTAETPLWKTDTVNVELSGAYLWIGFHFEDGGAGDSQYFYTSNAPERTGRKITNGGTFPDVDDPWDVDNDATETYGFACYLSY